MKKPFVAILAFLYLTTSVGATVHFHYCRDKLVAWGLTSNEDSVCSKCGMDKEATKGCCKDNQRQVKFQGEQKIASIDTLVFPPTCDVLFAQVAAYKFLLHPSVALTYPVSHAPPNKASIPVYLSNRVFRI